MISRKDGDCYNSGVAALVGYYFDDLLVHTAERDAASAQTDQDPAQTLQNSSKDPRHGVRRTRNRLRAPLSLLAKHQQYSWDIRLLVEN